MKKLLNNGPLLILTAAVLWAIDGLIRSSLYSLHPIIIVFFEHFIGTIILIPFLIKFFPKEPLTRKELLLIAWVSLLSSLFGTLWFTTALVKVNYISISVVFLLQKLQPLFAMTSAAFLLKEKIDNRYIKWAILALVAAFFVTFPNGTVNLATGSETAIAALYALGAAAAWGLGTTFSRMALTTKSDTYVTSLRFLFTTIFAFIGVLIVGQTPQLQIITPDQLVKFIFIALSTGMFALLIYYKGLKHTEVRVATILELAFPMVAVFLDITVNKVVLAPTQYIAAGALLFAMYKIAQLNKAK